MASAANVSGSSKTGIAAEPIQANFTTSKLSDYTTGTVKADSPWAKPPAMLPSVPRSAV